MQTMKKDPTPRTEAEAQAKLKRIPVSQLLHEMRNRLDNSREQLRTESFTPRRHALERDVAYWQQMISEVVVISLLLNENKVSKEVPTSED